MSVTYTLHCEHPSRCTVQYTAPHVVNLRAARHAARLEGWASRPQPSGPHHTLRIVDRCPAHPFTSSRGTSVVDHRVPPERCVYLTHLTQVCGSRNVTSREQEEVWHWCGHDQLGHRMANMFLRYGYTDVPSIVSAYTVDLVNLHGFGELALARWKAFTAMEKP